MAIAFETVGGPLATSPTDTHTVCTASYTVPAGSNLFMMVGLRFGGDATAVSVTYAGVAMTSLFNSGDGFAKSFYLFSPATGANTISFTHGAANEPHDFFVSVYSGVGQSGIKGSASSSDATSPADVTVTPDVSAWLVVFCRNNGTTTVITPNANTTERVEALATSIALGDTNGEVAVATLVGFTMTSNGNNFTAHALAIAPAIADSVWIPTRGLFAAQGILP